MAADTPPNWLFKAVLKAGIEDEDVFAPYVMQAMKQTDSKDWIETLADLFEDTLPAEPADSPTKMASKAKEAAQTIVAEQQKHGWNDDPSLQDERSRSRHGSVTVNPQEQPQSNGSTNVSSSINAAREAQLKYVASQSPSSLGSTPPLMDQSAGLRATAAEFQPGMGLGSFVTSYNGGANGYNGDGGAFYGYDMQDPNMFGLEYGLQGLNIDGAQQTWMSHDDEQYYQSGLDSHHDAASTSLDNGATTTALPPLIEEAMEKLADQSAESLFVLSQLSEDELVDALRNLLGLSAETDEDSSSKTLCKFYAQGGCRRADCWYSHDPKLVPCKYFSQGWCAAGDGCEFLHDTTDVTLRNHADWLASMMQYGPEQLLAALDRPSQNDPTGFFGGFEPSENAFPDLPGAEDMHASNDVLASDSLTAGRTWSAATPNIYGQQADVDVRWDGAKQIKWTTLRKMYPAMWEDDLIALFERAGFDLDATVSLVRRTYQIEPEAIPEAQAAKPSRATSNRDSKPSKQARSTIAWVVTGTQVSKEYKALRQQAIEYAELRNKLLQQSTEAFIHGDKAAAKNLSKQGRRYDELMKEQHRQAAQTLFTSRNAQFKDSNVLDLHGLHVKEALIYLESFLDQIYADGNHNDAYVITGTGHHSQHSHRGQEAHSPRLLPAVQTWVSEQGYHYSDASRDGKGGMVYITWD